MRISELPQEIINKYSNSLSSLADETRKTKTDLKDINSALNDLDLQAKKESKGKLYYELDFKFIQQMAERMQSNKENSKYDLWNWKKQMTQKGIDDLKQALLRHVLAVMENDFEDDSREFGHLEAIANNAMMINHQLKKEYEDKN